eukprot:CAMPEP_0118971882 /NCGR_PEP_ID=MMETSP1173-20130426/8381_1 /TAXON_ID=1034831 /ORGANISM="Rhizochromulina marina cf, Strain CCMP1243" /LENGTH=131 /DNA_ID=CAMNT_0006921381 /DNA_START=27 /DNA_END=422 /DNA_ORIENTATION=-
MTTLRSIVTAAAVLAVAQAARFSSQSTAQDAPSLVSRVLSSTASPFAKALELYNSTIVARYLSLPGLLAACVLTCVILWVTSKILDPTPFLYNDGKLGPLEKQSIFVDSQTGEFKPAPAPLKKPAEEKNEK